MIHDRETDEFVHILDQVTGDLHMFKYAADY